MNGVTIIIPAYNRADLLPAAIESVLAQDYPDVEIIVADDGSTDNTLSMLERRFGAKIKVLKLAHSGLPAVARNAGVRAAKGEFIAFLDSDDRWLPGKLRRQMEIMESEPSIGLVSCDAFIERPGQQGEMPRFFAGRPEMRGRLLRELMRENFVITSTALVRRAVLEKAGEFCEEPRMFHEDYDLWLRIACECDVAYVGEALAVYRDEPTSIRSERTRANHYEASLWILQRVRERLTASGKFDVETQRTAVEIEHNWKAKLREAYWDEGSYFKAIKTALCGYRRGAS